MWREHAWAAPSKRGERGGRKGRQERQRAHGGWHRAGGTGQRAYGYRGDLQQRAERAERAERRRRAQSAEGRHQSVGARAAQRPAERVGALGDY